MEEDKPTPDGAPAAAGEPADEGKLAREEGSGKSSRAWLYLIPIFILAAWPALKLLHKANSDSVELSKEEYTAFNSEEGEVQNPEALRPAAPELDERIMNVRYKSNARQSGGEQAWDRPEAQSQAVAEATAGRQQAQAAAAPRNSTQRAAPAAEEQPAINSIQAREQQSIGFTKGLISGAVKRAINNPSAVAAIMSNSNIVSGFMARDSVKAATGSAEGLSNYLKTSGPLNFINNPMVQAAINNPALVSAAASSGLVKAMLDTPAAKELMRNPKALGELVNSNPQLVSLVAGNPAAMAMITGNPEVSKLIGKFDISAIRKK